MPPSTFAATSESKPEDSALVALVLNRKAGAGSADEQELIAVLEAAGLVVGPLAGFDVDPVQAAEQAIAKGVRLVVAAGGDGTVSSVASVVSGSSAVLGVLPTGTLNHFAKDVGIPLDLREAAKVIAAGHVQTVDTAEVNGRVFINNSSLGLYPRFALFKEHQRKLGRTRLFSLAWAFFAAFRRIPFLNLRFHSGPSHLTRRTPLLFFGNNEYSLDGAGTRGSLTDGKLCVHIVNARSGRSLIGLSFNLLLRRWKAVHEIETLSINEATVESKHPRLRVSCDGEVFWMNTPLHYRIRPASLNVLAPLKGGTPFVP